MGLVMFLQRQLVPGGMPALGLCPCPHSVCQGQASPFPEPPPGRCFGRRFQGCFSSGKMRQQGQIFQLVSFMAHHSSALPEHKTKRLGSLPDFGGPKHLQPWPHGPPGLAQAVPQKQILPHGEHMAGHAVSEPWGIPQTSHCWEPQGIPQGIH